MMKLTLMLICGLAVSTFILTGGPVRAQQTELIKKGEYLTIAGGCISCHTDFRKKGKPFAGGAPIPTPFGTFYPPNITPSKEHGIGNWTDEDFRTGEKPWWV